MTYAIFQTCFRFGSRNDFFNHATSYKSPVHSSTGTRSGPRNDFFSPPTACQLTVSCSISLPSRGSFSPFPRGTSSLSVTQEYLALRGGPRRFTRDFTCPMLLGILISYLRAFLATGLSPSRVQHSSVSPNFSFDNMK